MNKFNFFEWLTTTPWANFMNGAEWVFPVVQSLHFIGFALSIGTIVIVDLRLLGFGMKKQSASDLAADLSRWTLAGIVLMLVTGFLMFSADAAIYHVNPSFRVKMTILTIALLFHFTIHRMVVRPNASAAFAKIAAVVSLLLWISVVGAGRFIAFT